MDKEGSASTIKVFVRVRPIVLSEQNTDRVTEVLHDVLYPTFRIGLSELFTIATTICKSNLIMLSTPQLISRISMPTSKE